MSVIPNAAGGAGMNDVGIANGVLPRGSNKTAAGGGSGNDQRLVYNFECSNSQWP